MLSLVFSLSLTHAAFAAGCATLQVETKTPPVAIRGALYKAELAACGGSAPYKWKKVGKLPKGLKMTSTGVIQGMPSNKLAPGSYPLGVKVTDSEKPKRSATATLSLSVTCPSGKTVCPWQNNDLATNGQARWTANPARSTLTNRFNYIYTTGSVNVGAGDHFLMSFETATAVLNYLPAVGTDGALTQNYVDPTTTSSGEFGGDILALQMDVDFADAGDLTANSGLKFGNLTLCSMSDSSLDGKTVRQFLAIANTLIGADSSGSYTIAEFAPLTKTISEAFEAGSPSTFAQENLVNGRCP